MCSLCIIFIFHYGTHNQGVLIVQISDSIITHVLEKLLITILVLYFFIWLGVKIWLLYTDRLNKRRKEDVWVHYCYQQDQSLTKNSDIEKNLSVLLTTRYWPDGEYSYFMMHNVIWQINLIKSMELFSIKKTQPKEISFTKRLFSSSYLDERIASLTANQHLFLTNQRILLVRFSSEKSIWYDQIKHVHLYVDTIEVTLKDASSVLLHGYYQPEVLIQCYQYLIHFVKHYSLSNDKK